ncbi:MAG TPA: Ig-like domain-containing protein [Gemmatimonadales bacterium]|nr:Ig-like domain-containing protein [Gemmatimonadales bacterium]
MASTPTITACASACSPGTTASTITVTARDQFGNLLVGAAVRDSASPVTGNVATASASTDGSGAFASTFFSTKAEAKTVAARINGVAVTQTAPVTVSPTVVDLALSSINASLPSITACASSCSTFASTASTITVTVVDTFSNPIPGASISYFQTGSNNTVTPLSGSTDVNGVFTSTLSSTTAETKSLYGYDSPFGYVANTTPVNVVVNPAAASSIAISSGNGQTARVGLGVVTKPTAVVRDAFGNPVPGVLVTFAGLTGGGSASGTSVSTNASGLATLGSWTLGGTTADDGIGRMANTIGASASGTGTATFTDYGIYTWSGDASPLISTGSVCAGCHAWTYAGIVNVTSSCGTLKYVVPSNAGTSYIYNKISTSTPSCGSEMPAGGPFYSAAQLKIVRAWINNGAQNN